MGTESLAIAEAFSGRKKSKNNGERRFLTTMCVDPSVDHRQRFQTIHGMVFCQDRMDKTSRGCCHAFEGCAYGRTKRVDKRSHGSSTSFKATYCSCRSGMK